MRDPITARQYKKCITIGVPESRDVKRWNHKSMMKKLAEYVENIEKIINSLIIDDNQVQFHFLIWKIKYLKYKKKSISRSQR